MKKNQDIFRKRKWTYTIFLLAILLVCFLASTVTKFHLSEGITSFPQAFQWIINNLIPDEKAFTRLPKILSRLWETTLLSIAVTVIAGICAFFFSLLGSDTTGFPGIIKRVVRIVAAFFRNVPDVVWAILLMFSFGQNILTGFFALFFTTFGLLTRAFVETIDEVSASCVEALTASGANFMEIVFQGIFPSAIAGLLTWILYMIETNVRSSTLIGILTATGIGYMFDLYYKRLDYGTASLVVISIIILVIAIEGISNKLRKVIL